MTDRLDQLRRQLDDLRREADGEADEVAQRDAALLIQLADSLVALRAAGHNIGGALATLATGINGLQGKLAALTKAATTAPAKPQPEPAASDEGGSSSPAPLSLKKKRPRLVGANPMEPGAATVAPSPPDEPAPSAQPARTSGRSRKTGKVGKARRPMTADEKTALIAEVTGRYPDFLASERAAQQELENRRAELAGREPTEVTDLPVYEARQEIIRKLQAHRVCLLIGETGSGKTLLAPYLALEAGLGEGGMIVQTEPRRVAARQIARRLSQMCGHKPGGPFGLQTRTDRALSRRTLCKIATDGILLNELRDDPLLEKYSLIILDEAHERSINIDLLLGMILRIMEQRPDLKLLISSATIDEGKFAKFLQLTDDQIINVPGRLYPVDVRYRDWVPDREEELLEELPRQAALSVKEICEEGPGDILVFVPRAKEIAAVIRELKRVGCPMSQLDPIPMHGRLNPEENDRAFAPTHLRKVIVATNIAETSLTVPGIRYVVDTGFVNLKRYNPKTGISSLAPERISAASMRQRAGRAGRVEDGVCVRLFDEELYDHAKKFTDAEILRSDLAHLVLYMKSLGVEKINRFPFIDKPDQHQLRNAERTLVELGALTPGKGKQVTGIGLRMAALPVEPAQGRMLIEAEAMGCVQEVLSVVACLAAGREPFVMPAPTANVNIDKARAQINKLRRQFADDNSDFIVRLNVWREYSKRPWREREQFCRHNQLSIRVLEEIAAIRRDLVDAIGDHVRKSSRSDYDAINRCVLAGHVQNVCVRAGKYDYLAIGRHSVYLHPGSVYFDHSKRPEVLVARALEKGETKIYAQDVATVAPSWIEQLAGHLCSYAYENRRYDGKTGRVFAEETIWFQDLTLAENKTVDLCKRAPEEGLQVLVRDGLLREKLGIDVGFLRHNADVLDEVKRIAMRLGDRSVIPAEHEIINFYAGRLEGCSSKHEVAAKFAKAKRLLDMRVEDFIDRDRIREADRWFPLEARLGGQTREVDYVDDPFNHITRVTIAVPVGAVPKLTEGEIERAVPGLASRRLELVAKIFNAAVEPAESFDAAGAGMGLPPAERAAMKMAGVMEGEYQPFTDDEAEEMRQAFLTADPFDPALETVTTWQHANEWVKRTRGMDLPAEFAPLYEEVVKKELLELIVEVLDDAGRRVAMSADFAEIRRSIASERIKQAWQEAREAHETAFTDRYQEIPALFNGLLREVEVLPPERGGGGDVPAWIGLTADPTANSFGWKLYDTEGGAITASQRALGHFGRMQLLLNVDLSGRIDHFEPTDALEERFFHITGSSQPLAAKLRRLLTRSVTEPELTRDDLVAGQKHLVGLLDAQKKRAGDLLRQIDDIVEAALDAYEVAHARVHSTGVPIPELVDEIDAGMTALRKLDEAKFVTLLGLRGRLMATAQLALEPALPFDYQTRLDQAEHAARTEAPAAPTKQPQAAATSERTAAVSKSKKPKKRSKNAPPSWSSADAAASSAAAAEREAEPVPVQPTAVESHPNSGPQHADDDGHDLDDETRARVEHNRRGYQRLIDRCTDDGDLRLAAYKLLDLLADAREVDLSMEIEWDEDRANDGELDLLIGLDDIVEGWLSRAGMAMADVLADADAEGRPRPSRKELARDTARRALDAIVQG